MSLLTASDLSHLEGGSGGWKRNLHIYVVWPLDTCDVNSVSEVICVQGDKCPTLLPAASMLVPTLTTTLRFKIFNGSKWHIFSSDNSVPWSAGRPKSDIAHLNNLPTYRYPISAEVILSTVDIGNRQGSWQSRVERKKTVCYEMFNFPVGCLGYQCTPTLELSAKFVGPTVTCCGCCIYGLGPLKMKHHQQHRHAVINGVNIQQNDVWEFMAIIWAEILSNTI